MKPLTKRQQQWVWFLALWCGGFAAMFLLAYAVRWMMGMA